MAVSLGSMITAVHSMSGSSTGQNATDQSKSRSPDIRCKDAKSVKDLYDVMSHDSFQTVMRHVSSEIMSHTDYYKAYKKKVEQQSNKQIVRRDLAYQSEYSEDDTLYDTLLQF